jgi:hypothetical protein
MADEFRQIQKTHCGNGGKKKLKYGCPCCRSYNVSLNRFKKISRRVAKEKLRTRVNSTIRKELDEHCNDKV